MDAHLDRSRSMLAQLLSALSMGSCSLLVASVGCARAPAAPPVEERSSQAATAVPPGVDERKPAARKDDKGCQTDLLDVADWPAGERPKSMAGVSAVCFAFPEGGEKACKTSFSDACILSQYSCGHAKGGKKILGTLPSSKGCCWKVEGDCAVGRPFVIDGKAVLASLRNGSSWSAGVDGAASLDAAIAALDPDVRAAIAEVWSRDALTEHASVASFARFILELLAVGAPASLVDGAQRALADELDHAQRAFSLASRYAGVPFEPGPLDVSGATMRPVTLADFAARTASEGCVAETIAALQLHAAADVARHPKLKELLRLTADEESDHALLAWRVVDWAIETGGEPVREAVQRVFDDAESHVGFGPCADEAFDATVLRAHGVLPRAERHTLAVHALASVVAPAAATALRARAPGNGTSRPRRSPSAHES